MPVVLKRILLRLSAPALLVALGACSVPDDPTEIHDPYEPLNRATHAFNKGLDTVVFRPLSQVYGTVLPAPVRASVDNAANNLGTPRAALNKALQGDLDGATHNTFRFLVNSTVGVLGFFDAAASFGLEERDTGFDETFALWGVDQGAYLELPILGPSSERAAVGTVADFFTNPVGFISDDRDYVNARIFGYFANLLNYRYSFSSSVDGVLYESADSYAQLRSIYLQNTRFNLGVSDDGTIDEALIDDLYGDLYDE